LFEAVFMSFAFRRAAVALARLCRGSGKALPGLCKALPGLWQGSAGALARLCRGSGEALPGF
jgi:hypothetical protein